MLEHKQGNNTAGALGWSKQVTQIQAVTDLLHGAAEVHARHSILVSLEVSLQGWIRLCRQ